VSGQVSQLYVDFNDRVKKGQLLARIDPTLQQQAVLDAQAGLIRAQADLERSKSEYDRNKVLFDQKVLTATEFNTAQYNYTVAQASVKSAQVALDRARKNLSYTEIYARSMASSSSVMSTSARPSPRASRRRSSS
jgi:HlyD family secretion protein